MRALRTWLTVLAALLTACSIHGSFGVGVGSEGVGLRGGGVSFSPRDDDDSRAKKVADWLWPSVVTACGESSFARTRSGTGDDLRLVEYWRATFRSTGHAVTATTGKEWAGYTIMRAGFVRWRSNDGIWSSWTRAGEVLQLPFKVVGDKWDWSEALAAIRSAGFVSPPDCSTLRERPAVVPPQ